MAKTVTYECEICEEDIKPKDVVIFVITRNGDVTESHTHEECLSELMDVNDAVSNIVLHD